MNFDELVQKIRVNRQKAVASHNQMAMNSLQKLDALKQHNHQIAIAEGDEIKRKKKKR